MVDVVQSRSSASCSSASLSISPSNFAVRHRELRHEFAGYRHVDRNGGNSRAGGQICVVMATAAGSRLFRPISRRAELGLIAGIGIDRVLLHLGFSARRHPAVASTGRAGRDRFRWAAPLDKAMRRCHRLGAAADLCRARRHRPGPAAAAALRCLIRHHTKDPTPEAMQTLYDLIASPFTKLSVLSTSWRRVADAGQGAAGQMLPLVATPPDRQAVKAGRSGRRSSL